MGTRCCSFVSHHSREPAYAIKKRSRRGRFLRIEAFQTQDDRICTAIQEVPWFVGAGGVRDDSRGHRAITGTEWNESFSVSLRIARTEESAPSRPSGDLTYAESRADPR
jgi:hypothetical protein